LELEREQKVLTTKDPPILVVEEIHSTSIFLQVDFEYEWTSMDFEVKMKTDLAYGPMLKTKNKFYYFQFLKPNTVYLFKARAYNKENSTRTEFSEPIEVKTLVQPTFTTASQNVVGFNLMLKEKIQNYVIPEMFQKFHVQNLNVLVLGGPGSGKSSFVNSIKTALEEKYVEVQNTFNSEDITTKRMVKFTINKNQTIKIWDSFGVKGNNYRKILKHLVTGRLKEGYNKYQQDNNPVVADLRQNCNLNDCIHAVLIAVSVETTKQPEKMKELHWIMNELENKYFIQPIVILTKCDQLFNQGEF